MSLIEAASKVLELWSSGVLVSTQPWSALPSEALMELRAALDEARKEEANAVRR